MPLSAFNVPQRRLLAVGIVCLVVLVLLWRQHVSHSNAPASLRVAPIMPRPAPHMPVSARPMVVVDVAGAVKRPGLVRVPRGSRIADAIARAGGLTARAIRIAVDLAATLADGQQVLVPARGSPGSVADAGSVANGAAPSGPVSLSTATAEQLDALPGVGPVTAQKIVAYRAQHGPFMSVEGLDAISGIGPSRIADLKGLVVP
jgi:competence protein ComEA